MEPQFFLSPFLKWQPYRIGQVHVVSAAARRGEGRDGDSASVTVGWGVPVELKDSHEESPVFPQPAALGKETEEVFMGVTVVAGVAPEWDISLQTRSRARSNLR